MTGCSGKNPPVGMDGGECCLTESFDWKIKALRSKVIQTEAEVIKLLRIYQSSSHKKPLLILSMRICGAIFLSASIAIGNRFYPFLSCFLLAAHSALASMFESTSWATQKEWTYSIFPSRNGVKKRTYIRVVLLPWVSPLSCSVILCAWQVERREGFL